MFVSFGRLFNLDPVSLVAMHGKWLQQGLDIRGFQGWSISITESKDVLLASIHMVSMAVIVTCIACGCPLPPEKSTKGEAHDKFSMSPRKKICGK